MNRQSYNPPGVCKSPIPIRLKDGEIFEADAIAELSGVTRSKVLRDAIIAGLPIVRSNLVSTSAVPLVSADFTGGDASASSAGLSSLTA